MRIYLGDLAYLQDFDNNQPLPLNIAYLATYTQAHIDGLEIEIFKDPRSLRTRINDAPPDVLGLSHYDWNANLNRQILEHCKRINPAAFTVMGGPRFDYDDDEWIADFFSERPELDAYVAKEGEYSFMRLIKSLLENGKSAEDFSTNLPSTVFLFDHENKKILNNKLIQAPVVDLNTIPSPYLTGLLDPFLDDERLVPIMETNRGCPYACAFCCWGKVQPKINQFSLERLEKEIQYVCERSKNKTGFFYIADANFGIFKRDIEIAKMFRRAQARYNFPAFMFVYFAKNTNEIVLNTAEEMRSMTMLSMSKQSSKPEVLEAINRKNIPQQKRKELKEECDRRGIKTFSELIFGFPGETYDDFVEGVVEAVNEGHRPSMYWFLMLSGAESGTREYREKYNVETAYRIIPRYVSRYDDIHCLEYEEVITANTTWSREDFSKVRSFQFLATLFGNRIFQFLNKYTASFQYNYADMARDMLEDENNFPPAWKKYLESFRIACDQELIAKEDLQKTFTKEEVESVNRRKLSLIPNFISQLTTNTDLLRTLKSYLEDFCMRNIVANGNVDGGNLEEILELTFGGIIDYASDCPTKEVVWEYDFDEWLIDENSRNLSEFARTKPKLLKYTFVPEIHEGLQQLLDEGRTLTDAVYVLRVNIMGYGSDDVFSYKMLPMATIEQQAHEIVA